MNISFDISNTGAYDGAEVIQVYLSSRNCEVVRSLKELKAYKKIEMKAGEKKTEIISLDAEAFYYWNLSMEYGLHNGKHRLLIGNSSENVFGSVEITAENGKLYL
ncbi:MAG: fibronectin type III-like domain-contianing protein [Clostridia bacterium]|nr:fibronectin type III-like domain-contianing protein [Clostridia bacterium]